MNSFQTVAILITLAAVFAFINHRYFKLHPTVGIMLQSLLASAVWLTVESAWPRAVDLTRGFHVDLSEALFHWMLGGLLFAGAMRVNLGELRDQRLSVMFLAVLGTLISTVIVAGLGFAFCRLFRMNVSFGECAIFGAVISPTDPVAVMGFLKNMPAHRQFEALIGGESLFNDGIGVVLFTVLVRAGSGHGIRWIDLPGDFAMQTLGGAGVGFAAGILVYQMLRRVNNYQVEVLLTLALAMGGYTLADALGVSGPIAAVVAGIIIGNHGRSFAVSRETRRHLDDFWELIDETLNAVLFLLVGLVVLQMKLQRWEPLTQMIAVVIVLLARWLSVWLSTAAVSLFQTEKPIMGRHTVRILTWGGLRGGLAVAMALSLPPGIAHDRLVAVVFGVVVFSVLVQGSTLPKLFRLWMESPLENSNDETPMTNQ
jgi:CPA1 family monovalent cation:H+ antiporter